MDAGRDGNGSQGRPPEFVVCTRMSGVLTAVREMAGRESVGAGQGAKGQKFHFGHVEPEIPIRNPRGWRRRQRLQAGAEEGLSGHSALTSPAPGRPRRAQAGLRTAASHTKGWREREEQGRGVRREGRVSLRADAAQASRTPSIPGSEPEVIVTPLTVLPRAVEAHPSVHT